MKKRINFFDRIKGKFQTAILEDDFVKTKDGRLIPKEKAESIMDSPYFEHKKKIVNNE